MTLPLPHKRSMWTLLCLLSVSASGASQVDPQPSEVGPSATLRADRKDGAAIRQDLLELQNCGSVLYVAAHPDDENTQFITYFSRGRHARTAYLSLTRGDGGQNVIGSEFGEELGVIRTQELLEARRIDGGRQFFTRAVDFGFSKNPEETMRIWDRDAVVADIVRVIREFRPDVIVTRFSPEPSKTHGHHTASAVLALEAFKLAGDPNAYPDQVKHLAPWQPKRIVQNGRFGGSDAQKPGTVTIDIGGTDEASGQSFGAIAAKSRAMHISQGFANYTGGQGSGPRMETFYPLDGEPASTDLLDGVDTTWARYPGGASIARSMNTIVETFNPSDPGASLPALLKLQADIAALPADPVVLEKREALDRIIAACAGLEVRTTTSNARVCPGETLDVRFEAIARGGAPVRWTGLRFPTTGKEVKQSVEVPQAEYASIAASEVLPADTALTQPYWLREPAAEGIARVSDVRLIGQPENPPVFPVEYIFELGGQQLVLRDQPVRLVSDHGGKQEREPLAAVPPVSLEFGSPVRLFAPGSERTVEVQLTSARDDVEGVLSLDVPEGWSVTPSSRPFKLAAAGDHRTFAFNVKAPSAVASVKFGASANVRGRTYDTRHVEIRYDHIPHQLLQPRATMRAVSVDLSIRGHRIGYIPGAGDSIAECLEEMGFEVTKLTDDDLSPEKLKGLDAVVVGVRAFNVRKELLDAVPVLTAFAEAGGTVVVQYNRPDASSTKRIAPYDLSISSDRVTDEDASVTLLAPDHPALNAPNKITAADFQGWVQERGLYFPDRWDDRFVPLIACSDPGEPPLKGGILVASCGKGRFVYTGLSWFRQLPGGVPGAYRLFANLVAPAP